MTVEVEIKSNARRKEMTRSQEKAIARIRALAEKHAEGCFREGELKKWKIDENEYFVAVYVEIGMKNDEGTLAEVFCRDAAHLFVGKRGGITYPVSKTYKNGKYKHYTKKFEGYSILQAVVDQR